MDVPNVTSLEEAKLIFSRKINLASSSDVTFGTSMWFTEVSLGVVSAYAVEKKLKQIKSA